MAVTAEPNARPTGASTSLSRGSIGQFGTLAQSIGSQAPVAGVALVPVVMAETVGTAGPLVFILGIVAGLLVSYTYVRITRKVNGAGGNYVVAGHLLGPSVGFVVGWGWILVGLSTVGGVISQAVSFAIYAFDSAGVHFFDTGSSWAILSVVIWVLVMIAALTKVKFSTGLLFWFEGISATVIVIVGIIVLTKGGAHAPQSALSYFSPHGTKISALALGVTVSFLGFGAFESCAFLGEEARLPKRQVPAAMIGALLFSGLLYVFGDWFVSVGFKSTDALAGSSAPLFQVASSNVSPWVATLLAVLTTLSAFACALGFTNSLARLMFALCRSGFLSRSLATTNPRTQVPNRVIFLVAIPCLAFSACFAWTSPTNAFAWITTLGAYFFSITYLIVSIGGLWYFNRTRSEVRWHSIIIPLVSIAVVGYGLYSDVHPAPPYPYNLLFDIALAWVALGIVVICAFPRLRRALRNSGTFAVPGAPSGSARLSETGGGSQPGVTGRLGESSPDAD